MVAPVSSSDLVASVVSRGDTHGLPFLVVDKVEAKVFAFDAQGRLLGSSAAVWIEPKAAQG